MPAAPRDGAGGEVIGVPRDQTPADSTEPRATYVRKARTLYTQRASPTVPALRPDGILSPRAASSEADSAEHRLERVFIPAAWGARASHPCPPTSPEAYARGRSPASRQPTWQSPLCPAPRRRSLAQPQCPSQGTTAAKIRRKSSRSWSCPPSTGRCSPPNSSPWNASG